MNACKKYIFSKSFAIYTLSFFVKSFSVSEKIHTSHIFEKKVI